MSTMCLGIVGAAATVVLVLIPAAEDPLAVAGVTESRAMVATERTAVGKTTVCLKADRVASANIVNEVLSAVTLGKFARSV